METAVKYIALEKEINYDWDDYGVWADILYDVANKKVIVDKYGHGSGCNFVSIDYSDFGHSLDEDIVRACLNKVLGGIDEKSLEGKEYVGIPLKDGSIIVNANTLWRNGKMVTKQASRYTMYGTEVGSISEKAYEIIKDNLVNKVGVLEVAHLIAYSISYSSCDTRILQNRRIQLVREAFPLTPMTEEMQSAYNILCEHREEVKKNRKRPAEDAKRAELKEWAEKKFPNESEEFKQDKINRALSNWKQRRAMMYRRW